MITSTQASKNGRVVRIRKGVDLPISGRPQQDLVEERLTRTVALVADDYVGMKPTLQVQEGDRVRRGQVLFTDKKTVGINYTAPAAGTVASVNRGEKRRFQSLVIEVDGDEQVEFPSRQQSDLAGIGRDAVKEALVASGLWTALRMRPYGRVPSPDSEPRSIFVTAMDTRPLALDPKPLIKERGDEFVDGLRVIRQLTDGPLHLCCDESANLPGADLEGVEVHEFAGLHPAGLPGTHIHFIDPVSDKKAVWHVGYQDVIAIGAFFVTGQLPSETVVSLAGPVVNRPRLIRTRPGASLDQLVDGELSEGQSRVISGSVLDGRFANDATAFLGRYDTQVSALHEGTEREFLGWQMPGFEKFSIRRVFASAMSPGHRFALTTTTGGSERAMVPIGMFEDVMPLDILPTFLLRNLYVGDNETAQLLGALELAEEDLALCTFVDPGKVDWGPILRNRLDQIEKEG